MIYLVKSKFSKYYTSVNTIEYYEKLLKCSDIPWYYHYYDYTLYQQDTKIPCNLFYTYVPRQLLNTFDKQLYYLHLQAVKLKKHNDDFYWRVDPILHCKFSLLWKTFLREKNDKIN